MVLTDEGGYRNYSELMYNQKFNDMQNLQLGSTGSEAGNLLNDFHSTMIGLPIVLRNKICKECGWSIHTYHHKCRERAEAGRAFSREEELTILTVYLQTLQDAFDQLEKHKNKISAAVYLDHIH